jgi:hypothetical protein
MRKTAVFALVGAMVYALSCAPPIKVNYDYNRQADFRAYKTYDWLSVSSSAATQSAKATKERDPVLDQRIKTITGELLRAKGFTQTSDHPDLLLIYHRSVGDKTDIAGWGYTYGPSWGYYGPGPGEEATFASKQETLILDLIDARKKELVFRGRGLVVVGESGASTEREKTLRKVLSKILANYPPG